MSDLLVLPRLVESLIAARVVGWLVSEGDSVAAGSPVVEVDAEKFVIALEVDHACVIEQILVREGTSVEVGAPLARLRNLVATGQRPGGLRRVVDLSAIRRHRDQWTASKPSLLSYLAICAGAAMADAAVGDAFGKTADGSVTLGVAVGLERPQVGVLLDPHLKPLLLIEAELRGFSQRRSDLLARPPLVIGYESSVGGAAAAGSVGLTIRVEDAAGASGAAELALVGEGLSDEATRFFERVLTAMETFDVKRHAQTAPRETAPDNVEEDMTSLIFEPRTAGGKRFVALAEEHATDFAERAALHDQEGSFPLENIERMQESGFAAACVPEAFGGLGLESLHDLALGVNRLARGDASTAIAINMHLAAVWTLSRLWRAARVAGQGSMASELEAHLRQVVESRALHCVVGSEAGTDILHPLTEAKRDGAGWRIHGRKIFGTLSPAASVIHVTVRVRHDDGSESIAMASVPRGAAGMRIGNDWNGLGMRASGSHTIEFDGCVVDARSLNRHGPWGHWTPTSIEAQVSGNVGLVAGFLGIAEAAREYVIPMLKSRRRTPTSKPNAERPAIQASLAVIEIDLAAARALLQRITQGADAFFRTHLAGHAPIAECHELMKEFQCAKWFVNRKAIDVVDRAMTLAGGSSYMNDNPLARMYRDVRSGPFMQFFSPNEAFEYIGKVALGLSVDLDD